MTAIYNELDPFAANWTRNLIAAGHIAPGVVDERSIEDLTPADVAGPGQRHFFSGICGWSYALRLAGIPDDADVWTGSCPCQPFSSAGKRGGTSDPRHLSDGALKHTRELPSDEGQHEVRTTHGHHTPVDSGATRGYWNPADWLPCIDGVSRPVEPGTFPLAHGVPPAWDDCGVMAMPLSRRLQPRSSSQRKRRA